MQVLHSSWGGGNRRRMFTINLTRQGQTPDEVAMVDRYLKAHCPVAHGFKIGGMCESAESLARVAFALRLTAVYLLVVQTARSCWQRRTSRARCTCASCTRGTRWCGRRIRTSRSRGSELVARVLL